MDALLGRESKEWRNERAVLTVWKPAVGVLVTRGEGHFDLALAENIAQAGNEVIAASGSLLGFHDWSGVLSYDTATRKRLTSWGYSIRDQVDQVHILAGSKLVAMGISVASIVLIGMLVSYDKRADFEAALVTALRGRQRTRAKTIPPV